MRDKIQQRMREKYKRKNEKRHKRWKCGYWDGDSRIKLWKGLCIGTIGHCIKSWIEKEMGNSVY